MSSMSVLFIPFDAAIQHYRRNATRGVKGTRVGPSFFLSDSPQLLESVSSAMSKLEISMALPRIVEQACREVLGDKLAFKPSRRMRSHPKWPIFAQRRLAMHHPEVVFLSEQPKGVDYPDRLSLPNGISYDCIGRTTTTRRSAQKIHAYLRADLDADEWEARSLTKRSTKNATEHVLVVTHDGLLGCLSVAGVHLSAQNVGASMRVQKAEVQALRDFCEAQDIALAIGDFNMDMSRHGGGTGARFASDLWFARNHPAPIGLGFVKPFTNSTNTKFFMGYLVTDDGARLTGTGLTQREGLSLSRSSDLGYFSDHAPVYVEIESRKRARVDRSDGHVAKRRRLR